MRQRKRSKIISYLRSCPFCRGKPKYLYFPKDDFYHGHLIRCPDCLIQTQAYKTYDECAKVWNRRSEDTCDKCGTEIISGKCSCGLWFAKEDEIPAIGIAVRDVISAYNDLKQETLLGSDHHSGTCLVLFKGDFDKCQKVKDYINELELEE